MSQNAKPANDVWHSTTPDTLNLAGGAPYQLSLALFSTQCKVPSNPNSPTCEFDEHAHMNFEIKS